jgi:protein-export membrane protein SecD
LVYDADTSKIAAADVPDAMASLREVIERRINVFGVAEPIIQAEQSGLGTTRHDRLIVELPGVTDVKEAMSVISVTPSLEFKTERPEGPEKEAIVKAQEAAQALLAAGKPLPDDPLLREDPYFLPTGLTGRFLQRAQVEFTQNSLGPTIGIEFNSDGAKLFDTLTKANIGKKIGIYLDNVLISAPVVNEEIRDGRAQISGQFGVEEARTLARNLNLGALPVPITLASTETVGATLGARALADGVKAGLIGFALVALFMILWYRLPGFVAAVALAIYITLVLVLFKLVGVTITAAGIAGLILSLGIAVDANVLIFERMKEELRRGDHIHTAIHDGFGRAWSSIRDSNISTLLTAIILFWFGSSVIKGFALTLIIGVVVSLFTAIVVTRTLLLSIAPSHKTKLNRWLFGTAIK